ncbi:MAG TPA: hypothetical protein QF656_04330 [Nitrosopumilus sp.]|jgi:hypothetical protein|nr:hypothetical protein [Nitrosopumilus sp.]
MEDVKKLIEEINSKQSKNYKQMEIDEISKELHNIMEFEQKILKKIKLFEKDHQDPDLIKYVKMICRNTVERETTLIQEVYLKKIDSKYLNQK